MHKLNFILKFALILACFQHVAANKFFDIWFTKGYCIDNNPKLCSNLYCSIKRFRNSTMNTFNLGCNVIYTPIVFIRFTGYYKYGIVYKPFALNVTANVCEITSKNFKRGVDVDFLLTPLFPHFVPSLGCPFVAGNISITNVLASEFKLPPIMPAGDYRIDIRAYNDKNQTILFPRLFFTVKAKGIADLAMG